MVHPPCAGHCADTMCALRAKSWPATSRVINKISEYMPKDDLVIKLIDREYDPNEQNQSSLSNKKAQNKLKGVSVTLKPVRVKPAIIGNDFSGN